jgi:hypothetical protein
MTPKTFANDELVLGSENTLLFLQKYNIYGIYFKCLFDKIKS